MSSFDRTIVVDWSARARPATGRDSIWIGVIEPPAPEVTTFNPATRAEACAQLAAICTRPGTALLAVDFSLGYPTGTAAALGLEGDPWRAMWGLLAESIDDRDDNGNNRFDVAAELNARVGSSPGPFWGCPPSATSPTLTPTKVPSRPLDEWRGVEHRLRRSGFRPFSVWQLLGAGSVGSQSLLGIARLAQLERALTSAGRAVGVWPFASCERERPVDVVIAEYWPSLYRLPPVEGRVRDEVQVIDGARRLADGHRRPAFDSFDGADDALRRAAVSEEGWILGA